MSAPLLTTKLHLPQLRPNLVPGPRLIRRLDEGLRLGRKLTLISAPAGFGKTTLLRGDLREGYRSKPGAKSQPGRPAKSEEQERRVKNRRLFDE